tara:strand:- start:1114 stop:1398 length:285 start_codon:yes stop_codon:yes gene_type:complete
MSNRFSDMFQDADAAFDGKYSEELKELTGLSKEEVGSVTPDNSDLKIYSVLIKVVEKASKDNTSKAQLVNDINELGEVAVKIAKKVPSIAALFI